MAQIPNIEAIAPAPLSQNSPRLYDRDFALWIIETVQKLEQRNFDQLDLENLIAEIEDMGKSQKHSLESNLTIIILHLLKWQYQPEKRSNSWKFSLREHRQRLQKAFRDSPSLKVYYLQILAECYEDGRQLAADETGLSLTIFPVEIPFTPEQILDPNFLP
jgi:phage pi2 protein 07